MVGVPGKVVDALERHLPRRLLLVAVVALLPYLLLPANPLLGDAPLAVVSNEPVRSGPWTELFSVDFWGFPPDADYGTRSYRPLVSLTYSLQVRTLGEEPWSFHAVDMALHALAAVLLLVLAERLGMRPRWALMTGLLAAAHPVQSEAIASVVGRADLMAAVFLLAALLLHLRTDRRGSIPASIGGIACLACALLCKEYAVTFPFIVMAVDLARTRQTLEPGARNRRLAFWIAGLVLLAAYLGLRLVLFGSLGGVPMLTEADHPLYDASWLTRWSTAAGLTLLSGRLLVWPFGLNHHYRIGTLPIQEGPFEPAALGGIVLVLGLIAFAVLAIRRWRSPVPGVAVALFVLPLAPSLNTISLSGMLFAERHLYLPACGLALLVGWGSATFARRGRVAAWVTAALVALTLTGAGLGAARVLDWRSTERLARSSLASYPEGAEVWVELGVEIGRQGRHDEAVAALARAVDLHPASARAWQAYGVALVNLGRFSDGAQAWKRSIDLAPGESGALWYGLAEAELLGGRLEQAESAARRAVGLLPDDPSSRVLLARILLARDAPEEAIGLLRDASVSNPAGVPALDALLGQALLRTGQRWLAASREDRAVALAREAAGLRFLPPPGRFLAALLAQRAGRPDLARDWFRQALEEDPELLSRKQGAARELEANARYLEAAAVHREILAAKPDHVPSLFDLGRLLLLGGRPEAAVEPLRRGLSIEDDPRARQLLGEATRATDRNGARRND